MSIYYLVYGDAADCDGKNSVGDATYQNVRDNTDASSNASSTSITIGQALAGGNYFIHQGFFQFDTSSIPSGGGTGDVNIQILTSLGVTAIAFETREVSSIANKFDSDTLDSITPLHGSVTLTGTVAQSRVSFPINDFSLVGRNSAYKIMIHSQDERLNVAPTTSSDDNINVSSADTVGTSNDPFIQAALGNQWLFIGVSNVVEVTGTSHALVTTGISGLQSGDLLIAVISSRINSTTSITLPSGGEWTLVTEQKNASTQTNTSATPSGLMAYCIRGSSDPNLTFTHPVIPSVAIGRIIAYRNVNQSTPKDTQTSSTTATNTTLVSVTGLTTAEDDELLVMGVCGGQESTWSQLNAATDPSIQAAGTASKDHPFIGGWSQRCSDTTVTGADTSLAIGDAVKATAGATGNFIALASQGAGQVVLVGAFKLASAGAATTNKSVSIGQTKAVSVGRSSTKNLLTAKASAVNLRRSSAKNIIAQQAKALTLNKSLAKLRDVSISQAKSVSLSRLFLGSRAFVMSKGSSISAFRGMSKGLSLTQAKTATLQRSGSKGVAITQAKVVSLGRASSKLKPVAIGQTKVVSLVRQMTAARIFSLTKSSSLSVFRSVSKQFSVAQAKVVTVFTGGVVTISKTLALAKSSSANLVRSPAKLVTVVQSKALSLNRTATKIRAILVSQVKSAALSKTFAKIQTISVITAKSVSLVRKSSFNRVFSVSKIVSVTVGRSVVKILSVQQVKTVTLFAIKSALRLISVAKTKTVTLSKSFISGVGTVGKTISVAQAKGVSLARQITASRVVSSAKNMVVVLRNAETKRVLISQLKSVSLSRGGVTIGRAIQVAQTKIVSVRTSFSKFFAIAQLKSVLLRNVVARLLTVAQSKSVALTRGITHRVFAAQSKTATLFRQSVKAGTILIQQSKSARLFRAPAKLATIAQAKIVSLPRSITKILIVPQSKSAVLYRSVVRRIFVSQVKSVSSLIIGYTRNKILLVSQTKSLFADMLKIFGIPARRVKSNRDPHVGPHRDNRYRNP